MALSPSPSSRTTPATLLRACLASLRGTRRPTCGSSTTGRRTGRRDGPRGVRLGRAGRVRAQPRLRRAPSTSSRARTSTPWLVAANADVGVEPRRARGPARAPAERDPGAGAVAPRLVLPDGSTAALGPPLPHRRRSPPPFALGLAAGDRLCVPGALGPGARAARAVGGRGVPARPPRGLGRGRAASTSASGCSPRTSTSAGACAAPAGRRATSRRAVVAPRVGRVDDRGLGRMRTERWQRATYAWLLRRRGAVGAADGRARSTSSARSCGATGAGRSSTRRPGSSLAARRCSAPTALTARRPEEPPMRGPPRRSESAPHAHQEAPARPAPRRRPRRRRRHAPTPTPRRASATKA